MVMVWDVFTSSGFKSRTPSANLEALWDAWLLSSPGDEGQLRSIFSERHIEYVADTIIDNSFTIGTKQVRTLYPAGDIDVVTFATNTNKSFSITTSQLKNGADTVITLYDPDGATVTPAPANPNDNWSPDRTYLLGQVPSDYTASLCGTNYLPYYLGPCHENAFDVLSSKITFTAANKGTYTAKIVSSPAAPVSAGRYGTYTLRITSP
jgi:hypothetical protein